MHYLKFALGAIFLVSSLSSYAAPIIYILGDHPAGGLYDGATNPYGIRVDDAPPPGQGPTFSVGTNLPGGGGGIPNLVTVTWDPANFGTVDAVITGSVRNNTDLTFWEVTYTMPSVASDANCGLAAAPQGGFTSLCGTGSIDEVGGAMRSIALAGLQDGSGFAFIFDDDGHRLGQGGLDASSGWSGRGWLQPGGTVDDWLVTGVLIPLPASVWLFGASLLSLLGLRRKLSR